MSRLRTVVFYGALSLIALAVALGGNVRPWPSPECGPDPSPVCAVLAQR